MGSFFSKTTYPLYTPSTAVRFRVMQTVYMTANTQKLARRFLIKTKHYIIGFAVFVSIGFARFAIFHPSNQEDTFYASLDATEMTAQQLLSDIDTSQLDLLETL